MFFFLVLLKQHIIKDNIYLKIIYTLYIVWYFLAHLVTFGKWMGCIYTVAQGFLLSYNLDFANVTVCKISILNILISLLLLCPRPSEYLSTWKTPCSVERWCGIVVCWRRATGCVTVRRVTPTPSWPSTGKRRTPSTFTGPAWWERIKEMS